MAIAVSTLFFGNTPTMATDYEVGAGQTYTTLQALRGTGRTFADGDKIIFSDANFNDATLASSFGIANGATLTLSGTGTISAAYNARLFPYAWHDPFSIVVADNSSITFGSFSNSAWGAVVALGGGIINLGAVGSNGELKFSNNSTNGGGPISAGIDDVNAAINILGGKVSFTNNVNSGDSSGAILAGHVNISGGTVNFDNNKSTTGRGGAVDARHLFTLSGGDVSFTNNSTGQYGGAIWANGNAVISGGTAVFIDNTAGTYGGAIFAANTLNISGGTNTFTDNTAGIYGGAIYANTLNITGGTMDFTNNSSLAPSGGGSGHGGGAVYTAGTLNISDGTVDFTNNSAERHGGAIFGAGVVNISGGTLNFNNNSSEDQAGALYANTLNLTGGTVSFTDNSAKAASGHGGGAIFIYNTATLRATNGDFLFQGNTDGTGAVLKANSIYVYGSGLTLAAETNHKIEFFDPIIGNHLSLNPLVTDIGTIIFDGSYWQEAAQGKNPTDNHNYFTTVINGNATLGYGTLDIKNDAVFNVSGTFTANGGTLKVETEKNLVTGGAFTLNGATLDVSGTTFDKAITLGTGGGTINNAGAVSSSGILSGAGSLTKDGSGVLTLSGANTYTGDTTISRLLKNPNFDRFLL